MAFQYKGRPVSQNVSFARPSPERQTMDDLAAELMMRGVGNINQLSGVASLLTPRVNLKGGPGPWTGNSGSSGFILSPDKYPEPMPPLRDNLSRWMNNSGFISGENGKLIAVDDLRNVNDKFGAAASHSGKQDRARAPQVGFRFSSTPTAPKASKPVSDYWGDFYRSVGIGKPTAPAPVAQKPMSVEDIYRGIYPAASPGLVSRPVNTVAINPTTGMPYSPAPRLPSQSQQQAIRNVEGVNASSFTPSVANVRPITDPTRPPGSTLWGKSETRFGYSPQPAPGSAEAAINTAAPRLPLGMQLNSGSRDSVANRTAGRIASTGMGGPQSLETPMQLAFEPMSDTSGQNMADSAGRPIVTPSGKTYSPRQGNGGQRTLPQVAPSDMRAPGAARPGLFASLFGGGQSGQQGGGFLSSLFGGGSPAPSRPSAAPMVAAAQAQGLSPSQAYAAANAATNNPSAGYTPSSSGQNNDWFSTVRAGGSYG